MHNVASGNRSLSAGDVNCENCHGNLNQHGGVGPVQTPRPAFAKCGECHGTGGKYASAEYATFLETAHANTDSLPDQLFFQKGTGSNQASYHGQPEWKDTAGTQPVTEAEHIEECSACHNYQQNAADIKDGHISNPIVGCNACHDGHRPADRVKNYADTRTADGSNVETANRYNLNFRAVTVDGKRVRPRLQFEWNKGGNTSANHEGYNAQLSRAATEEDDYNRLTINYLCASCHSRQQYKYARRYGSTNISGTHNTDVWAQYKNSGHGDPTKLAWEEFSSRAAMTTADPQLGHRPAYPIDMGGRLKDKTTNGTLNPKVSPTNGEFACFQCHNGIGTIDYMNGVAGEYAYNANPTGKSHIIYGDYSVGCLTCHDPHNKGTVGANLRTPVYTAYNSSFKTASNPLGGLKGQFLDLQSWPAASTSNICLFCHSARESGWTVWNGVKAKTGDADWYNNHYNDKVTKISGAGYSFLNSHYLGGGAVLWSANALEVPNHQYSKGITQHQGGIGDIKTNCVGCHMSDANAANTEGGHTWKPPVEKCQECHGAGITSPETIPALADYDGDGNANESAFAELGTVTMFQPVLLVDPNDSTKTIPNPAYPVGGYPGLQYGTGKGGTGLFGLVTEALFDAGIEYDPDAYPYMFIKGQVHSSAKAYKAFTMPQFIACYNVQFLNKARGGAFAHNVYYSAQLLIDSLEVLGYTAGTGNGGTKTFARPTGGTMRAAINYKNQTVNP